MRIYVAEDWVGELGKKSRVGPRTAHQQNKITSKPTQTGRVGRVLFICGFCVYFLETIIYCQWQRAWELEISNSKYYINRVQLPNDPKLDTLLRFDVEWFV